MFQSISARLARHGSLLTGEAAVRAFRNKVLDLCVETIGELRARGCFKKCGPGLTLMANISEADMPPAKWKKIIKTLNPG